MAKPMPCDPPEREKYRCIDAEHPAGHVHQGAAGIAGIDGRIGLDEHLGFRLGDLRAAKRRNDAAGYRLADAEGIADGQHQIAHFGAVGILKLEVGKAPLGALDLEHGKVRLFVLQHDLGVEFAPVRQSHFDLGGAADLHHMRVGDDDAVGVHDHAGAQRVLNALLRQAETLAEQPAE